MNTVELKTHILRQANREDVPDIIEYIRKEWNPNHIFVKEPEFFEYEHVSGEHVNGIVAIRKENQSIDGILLMYPLADRPEGVDFFGGIWSVSKDCKVPMLGYKLIQNVKVITRAKSHSGVGINPNTTVRIFKSIEDQYVGKLHHFYKLAERDHYEIAEIHQNDQVLRHQGCARFIEFKSIQQVKERFDVEKYCGLPYYKDYAYIDRRYFKHPIYRYYIYGIEINGKVDAVIVMRTVKVESAVACRIIDYFGEEQGLAESGEAFSILLEKYDCEYIDFYEYGISDDVLDKAGFQKVTENDCNVIPNYFEPFERRNVDIWFHTPYKECRIFKGDGDQDRPNRIGGSFL